MHLTSITSSTRGAYSVSVYQLESALSQGVGVWASPLHYHVKIWSPLHGRCISEWLHQTCRFFSARTQPKVGTWDFQHHFSVDSARNDLGRSTQPRNARGFLLDTIQKHWLDVDFLKTAFIRKSLIHTLYDTTEYDLDLDMDHFLWQDSSWISERGKCNHPSCKNGSSTAINIFFKCRDINVLKYYVGVVRNCSQPGRMMKCVYARQTKNVSFKNVSMLFYT